MTFSTVAIAGMYCYPTLMISEIFYAQPHILSVIVVSLKDFQAHNNYIY